MNALVLRYETALEFVRSIAPGSEYVLMKSRLGEPWTSNGNGNTNPGALPQATFAPNPPNPTPPQHPGGGPGGHGGGPVLGGPTNGGPPHGMPPAGGPSYGGGKDPVGAVPEPSAALLLALGMTVTGAHLRGRKR